MSEFNQEEFNQFVLNNNVIGFFEEPKILKSKRKSCWYVNWRLNDVFLIEQLSDHVINFTKSLGLNPDCFYGVPEGATKLGVITQFKWAKRSSNYGKGSHTLPMGRGKSKEHGEAKDRYFIGEPQGKIIVVEDVTTTGGSLIDIIGDLKETGKEIVGAFGLVNRMELTPIIGQDNEETVEKFRRSFERATGRKYSEAMSVEEAVRETGIPYHALGNANLLLKEAYKILNPGEKITRSIEQEFKEYGVERLTFT
ncbi:MAG: hypothetical protein ISS82_04275 [Nanoarchaeota archaeon]|nr:hypothetical protein [Nanoarchaeota archaeon]